MSKTKTTAAREKLHECLRSIGPEQFCKLVWSLRALNSGSPEKAEKFLSFPQEAIPNHITHPASVHGWLLEELSIEYFHCLADSNYRRSQKQSLAWHLWTGAIEPIKLLSALRNEGDGEILEKLDVKDLIPALTLNQFAWQQGFINMQAFYRNWFVYNGPFAQAAFQDQHGISLSSFCKFGFGLMGTFQSEPITTERITAEEIGITSDEVALAIEVLSTDQETLSAKSELLAKDFPHTKYRPNPMRDTPVLKLEGHANLLFCPLVDLLAWRISEGIYYDIIRAEGRIRREVGERFEDYCLELFREMLDDCTCASEFRYGPAAASFDSPDILLESQSGGLIIVECKFKRLPIKQLFDFELSPTDINGLQELAKGIFQIWRFRSHLRRGKVPNFSNTTDSVGLIVTMDPWLTMTRGRYEALISAAERICALSDAEISEDDKCPVRFCDIKDLEHTLRSTSFDNLQRLISVGADSNYAGWHLDSIARDINIDRTNQKEFPFESKMGAVMDWWDRIAD